MISKATRQAAIRLRSARLEAVRAEARLRISLTGDLQIHGFPTKLSKAIGISGAYLSEIRHGKKAIGDDTVKKLCEVE